MSFGYVVAGFEKNRIAVIVSIVRNDCALIKIIFYVFIRIKIYPIFNKIKCVVVLHSRIYTEKTTVNQDRY